MSTKHMGNAKLNALTSYLYFGIGAVVTFFISPLLISFLGVHTFGIWKAIQKLLDFATVADGRPTQALKWVIANKEADENIYHKRQAVGSALQVCLLFLPLLLLIVGVLIYVLPGTINNLAAEQFNFVRTVGFILGINIILGPLLAIPDSILIGSNQGYRSTLLRLFWLISSNASILYFAYQGHSLITISAVVVVAAILNGLNTYFITLKYIPWFGVQRPTKAQFNKFIGFSGWVLVWSLVAKGLLVTELLLLSYLIGAELVTSYVFSTYVTQLGLAVALMTGTAITPSLGRLLGSMNYKEVQPLIIIFRKINLLIAVVVGGGVLLFNKAFVSLWVGHEFYLGDSVNLLIVIAFVQLVLLRGESQIQDLSLKIKRKVLIGILSSFFSVLLAIYFYHYFDNNLSALFIGVILGRLIMSFMFPLMVNTYCRINQLLLKQYSMGGGILIICYYLSDYIFVNTWLSFLAVLLLSGCSLFVIAYTLIFGANPKELLQKWF